MAATVRNAICEQELGIRAHNRRVFLSHGTDWEPRPEDFARVLDEAQQGKLVACPKRNTLGRQWTEVTRDEREQPVLEGFDATKFGRRVVNGIFEDFCRRYSDDRTPPPKLRPGWKLRSVCVYEARLAWRDNRQNAVLRVQGLPAVRVRLHRPLPEGAKILGTVRIVRRQRGCRGQVPSRYEIRIMVETPAPETCTSKERLRGWDPGGRRSLTSDQGDVVQVLPRDRGETRRLLITYQAHLATAGGRKLGFRRPRNHVSGRLAVDSRSPTSSRGRLRFVSAAQMSLVRNQETPCPTGRTVQAW